MRVLLITRHMPARSVVPVDRGGGGNTFIEALLDLPRLRDDLQIDVVGLHPEGEAIEEPPNVKISYVRSERLHGWLWEHREAKNPVAALFVLVWTAFMLTREALRLTRTQGYDLIYAVGGPIAGVAGIAVKRLRRIPLAMHFQYTYRFRGAALPVRLLARAFYSQADALIGNCAMLGRDAVAIGMPAARCHWVFNWIDQTAFRPLEPREHVSRRARRRARANRVLLRRPLRLHQTRRPPDRRLARPRRAASGVLLRRRRRTGARTARAGGAQSERARFSARSRARTCPRCTRQPICSSGASVDVDYPGLVAIEAMSSGLPLYTSNETMNPLYAGERVDPSFLAVPRVARLFDPTRDGIRAAIREAIDNRDELNQLRPEVAAFAREHFGPDNALRLIDILRSCARPPREAHYAVSREGDMIS